MCLAYGLQEAAQSSAIYGPASHALLQMLLWGRADGRWRLYYAGRPGSAAAGPWRGVGVALTDSASSAELEGVRLGFRRRPSD